jgi:hypothetical protein
MPLHVAKIQRTKSTKLDTEVAILQVRVSNFEEKFNDIKSDIKAVDAKLDKNFEELQSLLKESNLGNRETLTAIEKKISALEKWRWMLMGGGVLLSYFGIDTLSKLIK